MLVVKQDQDLVSLERLGSLGELGLPVDLPFLQKLEAVERLLGVAGLLNKFPPVSNFSLVTPNSFVTATRGTFGLNTNSTASVLWIKQQGSGSTGWIALI